MKMLPQKRFIVAFVLMASVFMLSNSVFAAVEKPYFSFNGSWNYNATTKALTTTITLIGTSFYSDGTWDSVGSPDIIRNGKFILGADNDSGGGVIYNGGANSFVFGSSVGGTGSMGFSVFEGATNYMTATMNSFVANKTGSITSLNPLYNAYHITNIATNPSITTSHFLNDVNSWAVPVGNLFMQFNCSVNCTTNDFTNTSSGTLFGGKLSVVPEPISSILFLSGGATLAFRRYRNKKNHRNSVVAV